MFTNHPLYRLVYPRSILVAGASNDLRNMGTIQALNILNNGYKGEVYFLHPTEKEVLGKKSYNRVENIPENIELAVLITPTSVVPELMEGLGKRGVRRMIVTTAGFKEVGERGEELQRQIIAIAEKYKIRFIGPNCIGIVNTDNMLNTAFLPYVGERGFIGLASQSGTYVTQTSYYLAEHEIHFSKAFSLGNEANIDIVDALEFLGMDPQTKAIALYIETVRRGRKFIELCRAISKIKPIVALYVGGSKAGARAGMSHTGAMAGPDELYNGVFRQAGIIRAQSVDDMYFWAYTFAHQPPLKGKRIGVLTNSGGPGSSIADALEKAGLEAPQLSQGLQERLKEKMPHTAASGNPIDLTFHRDYRVMVHEFPKMLFESGEIDGLIVHGTLGSAFQRAMYHNMKDFVNIPFDQFSKYIRGDITPLYELNKKYKMPVALSNFFGAEDDSVTKARKLGLPSFRQPESAARAMRALYDYGEIKRLPPFKFEKLAEREHEIVKRAKNSGEKTLDELNAKKLLAFYGIPSAPEEECRDIKSALTVAKKLNYPVVLKAVGGGITHKTELGLIALGIATDNALINKFGELKEKIAGMKGARIAIAKQIEGRREFIAGATRFPGFGSAILFGLGGIFTEALNDITFRVAPITEKEALRMLCEIKAKKLLTSFRGEKAVSRRRLSAILVGLSRLISQNPSIAEIDINPVIVTPKGIPFAVDALIKLE